MMNAEGFGGAPPTMAAHFHVPIASLPAHWFTPSRELTHEGWPDFSVQALADWQSSSVPAPDVPGDCCLVLCYWRMAPSGAPPANWSYLLHETGGIWDEQKRLLARRLDLGERGSAIIHAIGRAMAQTNRSAAFAELDELIEYRELLNRFGLDCNQHIQALAEGFYPIDLSEEAWTILDVADQGAELGELPSHRLLCLAILAPNSSEW